MSNNLLPIIGLGIILVGVLLIILYKYWGPGYKSRNAVGYCPRHCGLQTCCQETQAG